jgi:LysR family transcriptional regulator (chromosome initiation inhibitor)
MTGTTLSPPSHLLPSSHGFVDAAKSGLGWGMNPEILVREDISLGALRALVEDAPLDVPIYWQQSRILASALAPLSAAIRQTAGKHLLNLKKI